MAAPALARKAAPARRPTPRPSRRPRAKGPVQHPMRFGGGAVAAAELLPHAAVRTAGAVRDLSDSSLIVRMTAGRAWIAVLGALLSGIVALNVFILSLNAGAGLAERKVDALQRENSALRGELAEKLSSVRIEEEAAALGMYVPEPKETSYLRASKRDLERAAAAIGGG